MLERDSSIVSNKRAFVSTRRQYGRKGRLKLNFKGKTASKRIISFILGLVIVFAGLAGTADPAEHVVYAASDEKPFVVVLDPGHGGNDPGTQRKSGGTTYNESDYNLKIAKECRKELSKYGNVIVYITRVQNNWISTYARAQYAKDVSADLFVSFHIDSSSSSKVSGASTIIPGGHYHKEFKTKMASLSAKILANFESDLSLKDRGTATRFLEDTPRLNYPDGTAADYFEVIRQNMFFDIPAIIIEHAFITNDKDFKLLNDSKSIEKLGKATARAIADEYGLKKSDSPLKQPDLKGMSSGVSMGEIKTAYTVGDVIDLSASGGSGEGEFRFYTSNSLVIRVEGDKGYCVGAGESKMAVTKYSDGTYTPRTSTTHTVTVSAKKTSLTLECVNSEYVDDKAQQVTLNIGIADNSLNLIPTGTVSVTYIASDGTEKVQKAVFNTKTISLTLKDVRNENGTINASYEAGEWDSAAIADIASLNTVPVSAPTEVPASFVPTQTPHPTDSSSSENPENTSAPATENDVPSVQPSGEPFSIEDLISNKKFLSSLVVVGAIVLILILIVIAKRK